MAELISGIAAASSEQAQGIGQVSKAVIQMDQAVQHNSATAEESAAAAEELKGQISTLSDLSAQLSAMVTGGRKKAG